MRVAIMQPTYIPWAGYMALIDEVDKFIFLDDVQFSSQSWQQRNRIKSHKGPQWLTVPVLKRGRGSQTIREVLINPDEPWRRSHREAILQAYARTEYLPAHKPWLESAYEHEDRFLRDNNIRFIEIFIEILGISAELLLSSQLPTTGKKAQRLVSICRYLGADEYLSPVGSFEYLDKENPFPSAGIDLIYQQFIHPTYSQLYGSFESHLSVVDLLLNEGPRSLALIRSGERAPVSHETLRRLRKRDESA